MTTTISTASDLRPWRSRLGWTQARAADELRIHVGSLKRLEGGRAVASGTLLRLVELLELHHASTAQVAVSKPLAVAIAGPTEPVVDPAPEQTAPAPDAAADIIAAPSASEPSAPAADVDQALVDALDHLDVPVSARRILIEEVLFQRRPRLSRIEGAGARNFEARDGQRLRESAWRASGDDRPLEALSRLVIEMAYPG